jgi:hypothetical protein
MEQPAAFEPPEAVIREAPTIVDVLASHGTAIQVQVACGQSTCGGRFLTNHSQ